MENNKTTYFSFRKPVLAILLLLMAGGFFAYKKIQVSLFPEGTFPKIKVIADSGEQPVELMMAAITVPLENAVKQVEGVEVVRSTTSRGSCEISIFLNWNVDIELSLQRVNARISQIQGTLLPNTSISIQKMSPSILPVLDYALASNQRDLIQLRRLAEYTVRPYLTTVEGVSNIQVMGGKKKEYWIVLQPEKMASLNISPDGIITALKNTNFIYSSGYASDYHRLYLTLTDATITDKKDIENLTIRNEGRRMLKISDLATVELHEQQEYTKVNANGKETVLINIVKQPSANLIDLSNNIEAKIRELDKILPKDVQLKPIYIQADFVNGAIKSVSDSILIGLFLAILVTIIFLRSLKASLVILITIPIILAFTIIILYSIGYTLNIMTLGAIAAAIGLIIDDAIVIVEQIHKTEEDHNGECDYYTIHKAIKDLLPAIVGSSLSTIVIFIPFSMMSGVAGAFFKVLALTMVITLVCSFLITWLGLPLIYNRFAWLKQKDISKPPTPTRKWLTLFIEKPYLSVVLAIIMMASALLVFNKLETGFLPEMDEGSIVLDYHSFPGSSLEATNTMLSEVDKIIHATPEVEAFSRRTGAEMGFFITEPNRGDYLIQLKKERDRSSDEVIDELRKKIESTQPGLAIDFGQVLSDMLGDLMSQPSPIEVKIFGNDPKELRKLARKISAIIKDIQGTEDVFNGIVIAGPSIVFKPLPDELMRFGLTPLDLQNQITTRLKGNEAGSVLENSQFINIRMKYGPNENDISHLKQSIIFTPDNRLRKLSDFTDVSLKEGTAEIQRENLQQMVAVTSRLSQRDLGSTIKEIQQKINSQITLTQGQHIEYGGAYAQQQQSFKELLMILISASLLVFLVLLFLFKDIRASLIILFLSVVGASGSVLALFLSHTPLNVGSYTGIIMIVGIIAENSIFTFQQFINHHKDASVADSINFAISARIRPKLMTATGAIIALMPLALGIGSGAQLHQPLAIAVIGGFCAALPLLLLVLPGLLKLFYKDKESMELVRKTD